LFTELAREFLRYLETREAEVPRAWLRELAHYEWIELALQISEASDQDLAHDLEGDLLAGRPALSPLAWPLAYAWPVHRIGPGYQPATQPPEPTFLLVHRETSGKVAFHELNPLAYRLLQRLDEAPGLRGREQLAALADEAGRTDTGTFTDEGLGMLVRWRQAGIVIGTHSGQIAA
jgi:hypothetical protein